MVVKFNSFFKHRRWFQFFSLLLLMVIPFLALQKITIIAGNYFSLRIWKIEFADPLFALQTVLLTFSVTIGLLGAVVIPVLLAALGGRLFCSFVCPYNLLAELLQKVKKKIFNVKGATVPLKRSYYWAMLGLWLVIVVISGFPVLYYVSMPGQSGVFLSRLIFWHVLGSEGLLILLLLIVDVWFLNRLWCKLICPVGALLQRFHLKKGLNVRFNDFQCVCSEDDSESPCVSRCPIFLNPKKENLYPFCFNCGACVQECQWYGHALSFRLFENPQKQIEEERA